jgi:hypothetical protein
MYNVTRFLLAGAFCLCFSALSFGQGDLGALTGSIVDPSGAVVPEATLAITNVNTGAQWSIKSSSAGYYRVPVPAGTYRVEVRKEGFKTAVASNIVVPVAQVVTIDLTLQVGSATQSVTVTSEAPLLTPSTPELSNALSPQEFATLPIALDTGGRQLMTFIYSTLPGTVGNSWSASINGAQLFTSDILIDGLPFANYNLQGTISSGTPSAEAASEFKVQTSSYSAEYGAAAGGVANFSMKSGTNQFHASAYEYLTNPVLNATGWNINQLPEGSLQKVKPATKENNFGMAVGGPIRKNKTFFFFNLEGDRQRAGTPTKYTTVPTTDMLKGDFSQWLWQQTGTDALGRPVYWYEIYDPTSTRSVAAGAIDPVTGLKNNSGSAAVIRDGFGFDPVTGTPGPNANVIPSSYFSTASAKLLSQFPTPINSQLGNNEVGYSGSPKLTVNRWSLKLDHNITPKHKVSGFFSCEGYRELKAHGGYYWLPAPGYPLDGTKYQNIPFRLLRLSEDWTINDHTINHFGIGFNRYGNLNGQPSGDTNGWLPSDLGITGAPNTQFPQINMASVPAPSGHPAAGKAELLSSIGSWQRGISFDSTESYVYSDTLSYLRGKHSFKIGGDFRRYRANDRPGEGTAFNFSYLQTALPGDYQKETGLPFASFLLGAANAGTRDVNTTTTGYRQGLFSLYAQDDWKATPKLTVSYGLRWEVPLPQTEAYDRLSALDPTLPNPGADNFPGALAFLGNCSGCTHTNAFQKTYYRQFAPRLGLAYQATQKMVWRAGYGISYAPPIANGWPGAAAGFNSAVSFGSTSLYPREFLDPTDPAIFWSPLTNSSLMPSWYSTNGRIGVPPFIGTLPDRAPDSMNYQSIAYDPARMALPYNQSWNVGFQYMLPSDILFEADYVGSKGTRLTAYDIAAMMDNAPTKYMGVSQYGDYLGWDVDQALADPVASAALSKFGVTRKPYPSFTGTVANALRPYPQFSGISNAFPNFGNSTYNALQATVRRRVSKGLNFIAAYTWSKTLSDTDSAIGGYSGYYWQDYYNQKGEKSITSFDYAQNLKLTWIYDMPFGRGRKFLSGGGPMDKFVGGWRITAIQDYRSGDPLQVYDSNEASGVGGGGVRADVLPGVAQKMPFEGPLDSMNGTHYLNLAAFGAPPVDPISGTYATRWGNASRFLPSTRGPGYQSEDFGVLKDIGFTERYVLRLRADFFNVFNRTGLSDPSTDVSDTTGFGRIYGVSHGPRSVMLSMRLEF